MGIMDSIDIGANALKVHGRRIDVHAKNIANLDTPNYVRKIPVLNAVDDVSFHGLMNSMKEDVFGVGTLPYLYRKNETKPFILLEGKRLGHIMLGIIGSHIRSDGYQAVMCGSRQFGSRPLGISCS